METKLGIGIKTDMLDGIKVDSIFGKIKDDKVYSELTPKEADTVWGDE